MTPMESQNPQPANIAFTLTCNRPWLVARFAEPRRLLGWSLTRPGFERANTFAWLEVRNADLGPDTCVVSLLRQKQEEAGLADAIPLITSRDVRRHHLATARVGETTATCLATVGLSNGDRVGMQRLRDQPPPAGTVNMLVHVDCPLLDSALVETVSIATQARTAAIIEIGWRIHGRLITGTGTDCVIAACPDAPHGAQFAGLHTDIGEAVGAACYEAVLNGAREWRMEQQALLHAVP